MVQTWNSSSTRWLAYWLIVTDWLMDRWEVDEIELDSCSEVICGLRWHYGPDYHALMYYSVKRPVVWSSLHKLCLRHKHDLFSLFLHAESHEDKTLYASWYYFAHGMSSNCNDVMTPGDNSTTKYTQRVVGITRQLQGKPPKVPSLDYYDAHNVCLMLVVGFN